MDTRIRRLLISFLCSLVLMSSQSSIANGDSGIAPALSIAVSVAGVRPNPDDDPPVKSTETVTKQTKSKDETPLAGVARVGRTLGREIDVTPSLVRTMDLTSQNGAVTAKQLSVTTDGQRRLLYVIEGDRARLILSNLAENTATFYLTSPSGDLLRVVHAVKGQRWRRLDITDALRQSFEEEKKYWLAKERELSAQPAKGK